MNAAGLPPTDADAEWAAAEQAAARHRDRRLHLSPRRRHRDRVLASVVAVCWLIAVALALLGLLTPGDRGYEFAFASFGGLALFGGIGGWWLASTGRYTIRGSSASI